MMQRTRWQTDRDLDEFLTLTGNAQAEFRSRLVDFFSKDLSAKTATQRSLSFEYHLTKDVPRRASFAASILLPPKLRKLRSALSAFAEDGNLHYLWAASALHDMEFGILSEPFDIALWHSSFDRSVQNSPFVHIGATMILETIASNPFPPDAFTTRSASVDTLLYAQRPMPLHYDRLLDALTSTPLAHTEVQDLILGAKQGTVLCWQMLDWANEIYHAGSEDDIVVEGTSTLPAF